MNNDSKLKFSYLKITLFIFVSLILHLMLFTNFNFIDLFKTTNSYMNSELEIFVSREIQEVKEVKKVKESFATENNNVPKKNEIVSSEVKEENLKEIKRDESQLDTKKSVPKISLDKNKILSNLSKLDFKDNEKISNKKLRIKNISAKSPEYIYRLYFEAWKKKVERMGAMNYPDAAKLNKSFSNLILKVVLNSNGSIDDISIIKTSGNQGLDQAAMEIVKNGSPYAPFSEQMKKEVDQVSITRIWKFTEDINLTN